MEATTLLKCPECGSSEAFKNGTRTLSNGEIAQRYICRACMHRYTYPSSLYLVHDYKDNSQICVTETKNLATAQKNKFCASDVKKLNPDIQGLLTQFYSYLEKEAYSEANTYPNLIKYLAVKGADLLDPESVKTVIARMTRKNKQGETVKNSNGSKMLYCAAYDVFARMLKIQWENPGYRQEEREVYVPYENELDALINAAKSRRMAAFLQTLKETFADPGEVVKIRWIDIDERNSTIKINFPVKNHNTGIMQVSNKLLSMLSALPHDGERVFPYTSVTAAESFRKLRKQVASIQQEPRILAVELRGFRHWGGTMIAYNTNGNVLEVKRLLRHKAIASTMKYIGKIQFKTDEFETATATTPEEAAKLREAGWVKFDEWILNGNSVHQYCKPKRFKVNA